MGIFSVIIMYTLIAPANAASPSFSDLDLFAGMTGQFTCLLEQDRKVQRIKVSDHLDPIHRTLELINRRGTVETVAKAKCAYSEASYTCEWGRRNKLVISMAKVHESATNRMQPKPVLKGHIKTGVFRPSALISCPLSISSRM